MSLPFDFTWVVNEQTMNLTYRGQTFAMVVRCIPDTPRYQWGMFQDDNRLHGWVTSEGLVKATRDALEWLRDFVKAWDLAEEVVLEEDKAVFLDFVTTRWHVDAKKQYPADLWLKAGLIMEVKGRHITTHLGTILVDWWTEELQEAKE